MSERRTRIEQRLADELDLLHLEVADESSNHNVPDGSESHFKVVAVAAEFAQLSRIERHRAINGLIQQEFDAGMHALAIHAYTESEWQSRFGEAPMSPPCVN